MTTLTDKPIDTVELSRQDAAMARESGRAIANFGDSHEYLHLTLARETGEQIAAKVPAQAIHYLAYVLEEMAKGNPVTLVHKDAELSTIQAAELMRVSRPHLVKLLEQGKIPFRLVGAHRRVRCEDLMTYMDEEQQRRKEALKELIAGQERLGLYE